MNNAVRMIPLKSLGFPLMPSAGAQPALIASSS